MSRPSMAISPIAILRIGSPSSVPDMKAGILPLSRRKLPEIGCSGRSRPIRLVDPAQLAVIPGRHSLRVEVNRHSLWGLRLQCRGRITLDRLDSLAVADRQVLGEVHDLIDVPDQLGLCLD